MFHTEPKPSGYPGFGLYPAEYECDREEIVLAEASAIASRRATPTNADDDIEFRHMLRKCRDAAAGGWGVLSRGEKLAAALVLNRADWLKAMDYTIAEAIRRIGPQWAAMIPEIAERLENEVQE